ncbi:antibiotic biosynthesis monooxygenase [Mesorhizobium sp. M0902]|uniref:putative quinol monooxygenase n=1 Tax=unclassified Mesorhizobium TaxID=325217 RepID=UPI003338B73F
MTDINPKAVIAEVTALPETVEKVRGLLCDYGRIVRQEPGNRAFACRQVDGRPDKFVVYEVYADQAAFETHLSAPENARLNAKLGTLVQGAGSVLTFLIPVE